MDISFYCSNCKKHLLVQGAVAGMKVACPSCQQSLIVPAQQEPKPLLVPAATPKPAGAQGPSGPSPGALVPRAASVNPRGAKSKSLLVALLGVGLVIVLMAVALFARKAKVPPLEAQPPTVVPSPAPAASLPRLRLAVTRPHYDDMGRLLEQMGDGYKYDTISDEDLENVERIQDYDVIFWTCDGVPRSWVSSEKGEKGKRPGTFVVEIKPEVVDRLRRSLGAFLGNGHTLYASDWRFTVLMTVFPELADYRTAGEGQAQTVTAKTVDPGLREVIGPEIKLNFDLPGWYAAAMTGPGATVYLRGQYQKMDGGSAEAPLLVKVPRHDGTIIFTSFHNEKNNTEDEMKILQYLVFSAVTARQVGQVSQALIKDGFSPARTTLYGAPAANASKRTTYHHDREGPLRFVLAFERAGGRLKMDIAGPAGPHLVREGDSTLTIEVPRAAPGDWIATITALKVPYENFPFTLTIGER